MEVKFKDFGEQLKLEIQAAIVIPLFNTAEAVKKTASKNYPMEKYSNTAKSPFKKFQNRKPGSLKN
ncbi:MAG: hypothetical protein GY834_16430, partial [Bacteroidetes bacterium]|nr:hypothetical protein [Bacteroidota bacterium]